jgi:hypothetical protein
VAPGAKQKQRATFHIQGMGDALHRDQNDFFRIPDHGNRFGDTNQGFVINCGFVHGNLLSFSAEMPDGGQRYFYTHAVRFPGSDARERTSGYPAEQFYKGKQ